MLETVYDIEAGLRACLHDNLEYAHAIMTCLFVAATH